MNLVPFDDTFITKCRELKLTMYNHYRETSSLQTPELDGTGAKIIEIVDNKPTVHDSYMRAKLNELFPGWSWEMAAPLHFLGSEWVVAQGHLIIIDESLLQFGIVPPVRKFYGVDSVRIQYKKDLPHTHDTIIDIGNNAMAAVTGALKRAINRLTGIADDIYGKQIELDGAGSSEQLILNSNDSDIQRQQFMQYLRDRRILDSKAFLILKINNYSEVTDWRAAYEAIKSG